MAGKRSRCVIHSAYPLGVEAARQLSIYLHGALSRGESPAEALRLARVELAKKPEFADPFYYGLITVTGIGHEPIFLR